MSCNRSIEKINWLEGWNNAKDLPDDSLYHLQQTKTFFENLLVPFGTLSARCLASWCNCSGDQKFWSRTFGNLRPAGTRNFPTEQSSIRFRSEPITYFNTWWQGNANHGTMGIKLVDLQIYGTQLSESGFTAPNFQKILSGKASRTARC